MGGGQSHEDYSVAVEDKAQDVTYGPKRRSPMLPSELVCNLPFQEVQSCWDLFYLGLQLNPEGPCLGRRVPSGYDWLTFKEVEEIAYNVGSGLLHFDLCPEKEFPDEQYDGAKKLKPIGVFMKNRPEWLILEQAVNLMMFTLIPLYDTLGDDAMVYIAEQSELSTLVLSITQLEGLSELLPRMKSVKNLVIVENETEVPDLKTQVKKIDIAGKSIVYWEELVGAGAKHRKPRVNNPSSLDCVQTLCYTSGTTGVPKGVIYTHRAMLANIAGVIRGPFERDDLHITQEDVHMSYLPLAHILERTICLIILSRGGSVGFYGGDVLKLIDDVQQLQPTVFVSVPRLYSRINDKITRGLSQKSLLVQALFQLAMESKLTNLRSNGGVTHRVWDKLVFDKTRKLLGSRLRFLVCGGAPLDTVVEERVKLLFCAPLIQGYGLTETSGAAFMTLPGDPVVGHIGGPIPWAEFCLRSLEEMGYDAHAEPPTGELLVRGPALSPGYFRAPDLTAEVFDPNGWFHTGDIGVLLPTGAVKIIDRLKNIFKLAQGEYVAPEKIETVYGQAELVAQAFVYGHSSESFLVAIIVPDHEAASHWGEGDLESLCANEDFRKEVQQQMEQVGEQNHLKGFERVKGIRLISELFSPENGLLTPTLKLKRNVVQKKYAKEIEQMYAEIKG